MYIYMLHMYKHIEYIYTIPIYIYMIKAGGSQKTHETLDNHLVLHWGLAWANSEKPAEIRGVLLRPIHPQQLEIQATGWVVQQLPLDLCYQIPAIHESIRSPFWAH